MQLYRLHFSFDLMAYSLGLRFETKAVLPNFRISSRPLVQLRTFPDLLRRSCVLYLHLTSAQDIILLQLRLTARTLLTWIICRINLFLMRKTERAIEVALTDTPTTRTPAAPTSLFLHCRLPHHLRLHIIQSSGFRGYYFVFPSLSEGSSL